MPRVFFENTNTGKQYDVVKVDKDAKTITLKGQHHEFTEPMDKERFAKMGYVLKQEA